MIWCDMGDGAWRHEQRDPVKCWLWKGRQRSRGLELEPSKSKQTLKGQGRIIKIASIFSQHKFNAHQFITIP